MNREQEKDVLRAWSQSAPFWEKHRDTIGKMFQPITRAMIEDAGIAKGQSVFDVAGGIGEPSLTVADVVGPSGSVTCTDAVAEMVAAAEREAQRRAIANIKFRQCAADSLPFESNSFDKTICRLGAMFFPDPLAALSEMLRVTRPGGSLTLAVWYGNEFNPFFRIVTEIMSRYTQAPAEDPNAPGAFRFAEPTVLANILKQAGAVDVSERLLKFRLEANVSLEEFWPLRVEISDTLREKVAKLSAEQMTQVAQEVQKTAREFFPNNRMSFPAQAIIVTGRKSG